MPSTQRTNKTDFSVLMSLYEKENPIYLDKCLESLFKQTLPPSEIVLVLDGPVPRPLLDVVENWQNQLPIQVLALPKNIGLGRALANGLEMCRHELVARMDTDDICSPYRFERQLAFMSENPDITLIGSYIEEIDPETEQELAVRRVPLSSSAIRLGLPTRNPFNHMTVMFRKAAVLEVGSYLDFPLMEDWYLWARLIHAGHKGVNIPQSLVRARTGTGMIARRGGVAYVKSEYSITKYFITQGLTPFWRGWCVFLGRAVARLIPSTARRYVYKLLRN